MTDNCALFVLLAFVFISQALACAPGSEKSVARLKLQLGITPTDVDPEFKDTGFSDDYVQASEDLNCDFATPSACGWRNMINNEDDPDALDHVDFYLFEKTETKVFPAQVGPKGNKRTPDQGDSMLLSGSEGAPAKASVLYSSPIQCSENPTKFSVKTYYYSSSRLRILLLDPLNLGELGYRHDCQAHQPVCEAEIPAQEGPFVIAIQAHKHLNSFVIIDDIQFSGDLGDACTGNSFEFGTKEDYFASAGINEPIKSSNDLQCFSWDGLCRWSARQTGAFDADAMWMKHSGAIEPGTTSHDRWTSVTGKQDVPDEDFLMARGSRGEAVLESALIECQPAGVSGLATFQAWSSEGTRLRVCLVEEDLAPAACQTLARDASSSSFYQVEIEGPVENKRLALVADEWNDGEGGFVALDNLQYSAMQCSETTPTTTASPPTTTPSTTPTSPPTTRPPRESRVVETPAPPVKPRPAPATTTTQSSMSNSDVNLSWGSNEVCREVPCHFDGENVCGYNVDPLSAENEDVYDDSPNPHFALRRGVFGNRVTGILPRNDNESDQYAAVYLKYGQASKLSVDIESELQAPRVIAFYYYDATRNTHLEVCCDDFCQHISDAKTPVRGYWPEGEFMCPKGTKQISWLCRNDLPENGGRLEGGCAIDDIRVYKTTFDGKLPTYNLSSYRQDACPPMPF